MSQASVASRENAWKQRSASRVAGVSEMTSLLTSSARSTLRSITKSEIERTAETKEKTGVFVGAYATNPVNGDAIPIFIADYVLTGYGTGAIMAVPGQDQRDWEFAEVFDLPIVRTVQPPEGWEGDAFAGEGPAINSGFLDGLGTGWRALVAAFHGAGIALGVVLPWLALAGLVTAAVLVTIRLTRRRPAVAAPVPPTPPHG